MCLGPGVPGASPPPPRVRFAFARTSRDLPVSLLALDGPVEAGDWLLVHCGLALARLSDGDARAALAIRAPEVSP